MLCPTTASADVIHVACPLLFTAFAAQMVALPSLKSTVPVTIPAPGLVGDTEAVKVTGWPNTDGLADVTIAVVVLALLTFCVTGMRRPKGSGAGSVAGRNALSHRRRTSHGANGSRRRTHLWSTSPLHPRQRRLCRASSPHRRT